MIKAKIRDGDSDWEGSEPGNREAAVSTRDGFQNFVWHSLPPRHLRSV